FEPGARLVLTHGLAVRPRAAAFFAKTPAATITDGFDVFVQLVIAAITTDPSCNCPGGAVSGSGGFAPNGPDARTSGRPAAAGFGCAADFNVGRASANAAFMSVRATRSCGRLGPARLGTTVAKSSSRVSE